MFWSHFFKKNQIVFVPKSSIGGFSGFSDLDRRSQGVPRRFFADLLTFSGKKVKIFKKLHPSLSHYAPYTPPPQVQPVIFLYQRYTNFCISLLKVYESNISSHLSPPNLQITPGFQKTQTPPPPPENRFFFFSFPPYIFFFIQHTTLPLYLPHTPPQCYQTERSYTGGTPCTETPPLPSPLLSGGIVKNT